MKPILSITIVDWVFAYISSIPPLPEQESIHFDISPDADFWLSAATHTVCWAETAHTAPRTAAVIKGLNLILLPSILLTVSEACSSINEGLSVHILSYNGVENIVVCENGCRIALLTENEYSTHIGGVSLIIWLVGRY